VCVFEREREGESARERVRGREREGESARERARKSVSVCANDKQ